MLIPDNLKSAVSKSCRYDPELNPSYQQLAAHYQVAVLPARPYKPKDKTKAEVGVQVVERWILARLRHQTFFSLAELNHCIRALLTDLNQRPFKQWPGNRRQWFEQLDKPNLSPLPKHPYQFVDIKKAKVNSKALSHPPVKTKLPAASSFWIGLHPIGCINGAQTGLEIMLTK